MTWPKLIRFPVLCFDTGMQPSYRSLVGSHRRRKPVETNTESTGAGVVRNFCGRHQEWAVQTIQQCDWAAAYYQFTKCNAMIRRNRTMLPYGHRLINGFALSSAAGRTASRTTSRGTRMLSNVNSRRPPPSRYNHPRLSCRSNGFPVQASKKSLQRIASKNV